MSIIFTIIRKINVSSQKNIILLLFHYLPEGIKTCPRMFSNAFFVVYMNTQCNICE